MIISGPSVILAWLKLRRRTLGPLLEASGWAINGQVKINLLLGGLLTSKAELPTNARRNLTDPLKKRNKKARILFWSAILLGVVIVGTAFWFKNDIANYFKQQQQLLSQQQNNTTEKQ